MDIEALDERNRTPLMNAAEDSDLAQLRRLLDAGADPDRVVNDWTALHDAADEGFAEGVALLLASGARSGLDAPWLRAHLRSEGSTPLPTLPPAIGYTRSLLVLRLLMAAGEDAASCDRHALLEMLGGRHLAPLGRAADSYARDFAARRGTANPERIVSAFWEEMIETGHGAYRAWDTYGLPERVPVWTAERFGHSLTALPDGRLIGIAGEHEDYYDADFYIYNDVIVHHPDGSRDIFGYPASVFPPTDFHSATLADDGFIYIIGNVGYPIDRVPGHTPVYRLSTRSMAIEAVQTTGPAPGWIGQHRAMFQPERRAIAVWGGQVLSGASTGCGARLRLDTRRWEPVPWLQGAAPR